MYTKADVLHDKLSI